MSLPALKIFYFLAFATAMNIEESDHELSFVIDNFSRSSPDPRILEKFKSSGPYMSSRTFHKLVEKNNLEEIIHKICPLALENQKCSQDISDFENSVSTDTNIGISKVPGGSFGTLYKISDTEAVKVITVVKLSTLKYALEEINVSRKISLSQSYRKVDNLLMATDCCSEAIKESMETQTKAQMKFFISQSYMKEGNLRHFMYDPSKFEYTTDYKWKLEIIHGILKGLSHLHNQNYAHRDLKPDNIFLDSPYKPMLSNFHFSDNVDFIKGEKVGAFLYMPPEMNQPENVEGLSVDIYSLAILFFEILNVNNYRITNEIKNNIWGFCPSNESRSINAESSFKAFEKSIYCENFHKFILAMMKDQPSARPGIQKVIEFFNGKKSELGDCVNFFRDIKRCDIDSLQNNYKERVPLRERTWRNWDTLLDDYFCTKVIPI
jgi:serine/threonine protein kinase